MAMEGEPIDDAVKATITRNTVHKLLSHSRRNLWHV